ncbi:hypothetical protein BD413DRAFT_608962 [Trametes elegans]|nr:hypothetical protein BD413DRAFT_608962 [Trametes elegans]
MTPALSPSAPPKPWWSRSKSSREQLRANRSFSSLTDDSEKYSAPSPSSSKHRDGLPSLKFNSLASAIGLKSKKLPALTIQDPPSPESSALHYHDRHSRPGTGTSTTSTSDHHVPFFTNRPPAKSVSTVRSSEYDFDAASDPHTISEPRTPSDHPRDRMSYQTSVMTFSEIDPFASGGIVVQHLPQDPNRLSAYSDSSMLDPNHQKRGDLPHNRRSYGSSSSHSHGNSSDGQALSPLSVSSYARSPPARSAYDLTQPNDAIRLPVTSHSQTQRTRRTKTPSGSNSSNSTVTPEGLRNRVVSDTPGGPSLPRKRSSPTLSRPRGKTVGALGSRDSRPDVPRAATRSPDVVMSPLPPLQVRRLPSGSSSPSSSNTPSPSPISYTRSRTTSNTPSIESPISPTRPLVVVRKASSSRVNLPPLHAAPPMSNLPPPPPSPVPRSPYRERDHDLSPLDFRTSSSSSLSLNFAPSVDGYHDMDSSDALSQLINEHYDLGPFEMREPDRKGKRRSHRNTYVIDGDLSPTAAAIEPSLPSPLGKFPPVPAFIHGDLSASKAGKLLKKMSSQQSLSQRLSATSITSSASQDEPSHGHASSSGKSARKQRSFHHTRVPLPPIPGLRQGSSGQPSGSLETLPAPSSPVVEPRRSSVTSPRKRLFSTSSARRSSSSHGPNAPSEDDSRSVFSIDTDLRPGTASAATDHITLSFGGGGLSLMTRNACISPSSLWEDSSSPGGAESSKRTSQSEYVPQYIMSPAEQLRLAEKLEDAEETEPEPEPERRPKLDLQPGDFGLAFRKGGKNQGEGFEGTHRARSDSILSHASTGTLAFGSSAAPSAGGNGEHGGVSRGSSVLSTKSVPRRPGIARGAPPSALPPRKIAEGLHGPSRSTSMLARSLNKPPPVSARPSTAQGRVDQPTSPTVSFAAPDHSPEAPSTSLPPPPRRRPSRTDLKDGELASKRVSIVPINPLSPPPVRPRPRRQPASDPTVTTTTSRPPSAFDRQKILQRRSIMKKPSFLDIDDEADASAESVDVDVDPRAGADASGAPPSTPESFTMEMESSFLDMDRKESFDTVRSTDSAYYVY